jgi:hypothetical protein
MGVRSMVKGPAIDPFREGFKDGSMWGRLVGLFKKHFRKNSSVDLRIVEGFELYDKIYLGTHYGMKSTVNIFHKPEPSIRVEVSSSGSLSLEKYDVDSYRQTLIALFLDADLKATARSEQVMFRLKKQMEYIERIKEERMLPEDQEQIAQWPIPVGTKWALVVVKCEPYRRGEQVERMKIKGMSAVRVWEL